MNPLSWQGEEDRLGLCGKGRCPVSLHDTGQCDVLRGGVGWALLQEEQELEGPRGVQRLGTQP